MPFLPVWLLRSIGYNSEGIGSREAWGVLFDDKLDPVVCLYSRLFFLACSALHGMRLCCRLKTHLQGLPVCRVSFTGETRSSCFVWGFGYYLEKRTTTSSLQCSWDSQSSGTVWTSSAHIESSDTFFKERNLPNPFSAEWQRIFLLSQLQLWRGKCAESTHRSQGARAVCVLWLSRSRCCSGPARDRKSVV